MIFRREHYRLLRRVISLQWNSNLFQAMSVLKLLIEISGRRFSASISRPSSPRLCSGDDYFRHGARNYFRYLPMRRDYGYSISATEFRAYFDISWAPRHRLPFRPCLTFHLALSAWACIMMRSVISPAILLSLSSEAWHFSSHACWCFSEVIIWPFDVNFDMMGNTSLEA